VKDNVWYLDDQNIVYPAGNNIVVYDTVHRAQKFIAGNEKSGGITAVAVSPNKRYVAVAEELERATVSIFDLSTQRRKKALVTNDIISKVCSTQLDLSNLNF
jgi:hypothetical protein